MSNRPLICSDTCAAEITQAVAAQGSLQTSVLPPPPIRSATDILMVTTMTLVWTVSNSALSWGCNYATQIPAESVPQCKYQFARSGQISEFHIFAPPNTASCTVPPGAHAPLCPASRRHCTQDPNAGNSHVTTHHVKFHSQ